MAGSRKALVLGGGGITGIAWELGVIAGLGDAGVDLTSADVVVGTSAGSVVGAQILSGASLATLFAEQLVEPAGEGVDRVRAGALARFVIAALWPGDGRRGRAYLGHAALSARTIPEPEWRRRFESMLHGHAWPGSRLVIAAVDAQSGELRTFENGSGVGLIEAVSASCAVPLVYPPVTIDGRPVHGRGRAFHRQRRPGHRL